MPGKSKPAIHRDPFAPGPDPRRQNGRKLGSRAKLAKRFFEDMYAALEEQGESVIARAMFHDPVAALGVVARLMPQKIEVTTPTDGMSDERLAEMLDFAERMAAAAVERHTGVAPGPIIDATPQRIAALPPAHSAAHENGLHTAAAEAGGGGPLGSTAPGVITTASPVRAAAAEKAAAPVAKHNTLEHPTNDFATADSHSATLPEASETLVHPVGRPFPRLDHDVERANKRGLSQRDDDIDPASLF